jgi:hypothetical protein
MTKVKQTWPRTQNRQQNQPAAVELNFSFIPDEASIHK